MIEYGLETKVAIITGGYRGIGHAIANKLAEEKAIVVITGRNLETAQHVANELKKSYGTETLAIKHDVTDENSTIAMINTVIDKFNKIDILINNAGIVSDSLLVSMKSEAWDSVLSTNLSGAFYCMKYVSKQMLKHKSGRIVNIVSVVGMKGNIGQSNYSASKAGLIGLTKTAAKELARKGITINAVAPGYIVSDMTDTLSDSKSQELLQSIPANAPGSPADVANCVLFLLSNQANYITGQVINVDGGMTI